MFDRIRTILARISREPRYPNQTRVGLPTRTLAGVQITSDNAAQIPAVWGCVKYISESIAYLPWHVMLRTGANSSELKRDHPVEYLIAKRPSPEWSSFQFRETMLHWALLYGNGYAEVERDQYGRPLAMWPIQPWRVCVCRDPASGELYYEVDGNDNQARVQIQRNDMFHLRGFGDGVVGLDVARYAAQTLGWARAASLFGATFFGNGMSMSGVVINKVKLSEAGLKQQKAEFEQLFRGPRNAHRWAHTDNDTSIVPLTIDPAQAQMVEVHHLLVQEICRLFGVPPHVVAELSRSTNNNIEHQSIEAVQRCLTPWVKRLEDEADDKLFAPSRDRGFYTRINMAGLLRGDFKSQADGFQVLREIGAVSTNDIREKLDMNPIPSSKGGDKLTMNGAYTTLDNIGALPAPAPSAPTPASPKAPPPAKALLGEPTIERLGADETAAIEELTRMVSCPVP